MSKVVCDICGTVYPESSEKCPICGCSRDFGLDDYEEELLMGASDAFQSPKKKSREIFDFDEVNQEEEPEDEDDSYDEEEEYAEETRSNMVLVVVLLVLIVLLLLTAGFFFVRYMLPNLSRETEPTETTAAIVETQPVETEPVETTEPTIPCTDIVVPGGKIELGKDGMWLMNVQVYPENTTDLLTYVSYDENIVTVNESGTVTAVGEGETVIEVSCGVRQIKCNVIVDYALDDATEATGVVPALQVEQTGAAEETQAAAESSEATEPAQTTEATEAPAETTAVTELKLKKNDITMFAMYSSAMLELDCDIPMEDIKWFTMDSTVAIVQEGKVTATGSGMTRIYAEYKGQQVQCIVRCTF